MADRPQLRIDASKKVINRAKAVAYLNGQTLTEFVLQALTKVGDKELAKLIEEDLEERANRGRPQIKK
jgi:uncharacterized protein (DUF1778 family)